MKSLRILNGGFVTTISDCSNIVLHSLLLKYQILLDNMMNDKIPRKQKPSYKEMQKEYGELAHRRRLYDAIDNLNNSYEELVKAKAINKIEDSIKL